LQIGRGGLRRGLRPWLLFALISPLVGGCGDAGGPAPPETGGHESAAASEAPPEYRDPEKIVERRAALKQRVRASFDEPRMLAATAEQYDFPEGYRPTAAYNESPLGYFDPATGRWASLAFECRNPACK
jgi:hypothetical protein